MKKLISNIKWALLKRRLRNSATRHAVNAVMRGVTV